MLKKKKNHLLNQIIPASFQNNEQKTFCPSLVFFFFLFADLQEHSALLFCKPSSLFRSALCNTKVLWECARACNQSIKIYAWTQTVFDWLNQNFISLANRLYDWLNQNFISLANRLYDTIFNSWVCIMLEA